MGTLRGDGIPDFLKTLNQVEELSGVIIHGITLRASVSRQPLQRREPASWATVSPVWQVLAHRGLTRQYDAVSGHWPPLRGAQGLKMPGARPPRARNPKVAMLLISGQRVKTVLDK